MDGFVNQVSGRFQGQEMIRANAEAEAAEMEKVKAQAEQLKVQSEQAQSALAQYEQCVQEMRALSQRSAENAEAVQALIDEAQAVLASCKTLITSAAEDGAESSAASGAPVSFDTEALVAELSESININNSRLATALNNSLAENNSRLVAELGGSLNESLTESGGQVVTALQGIMSENNRAMVAEMTEKMLRVTERIPAEISAEMTEVTGSLTENAEKIGGITGRIGEEISAMMAELSEELTTMMSGISEKMGGDLSGKVDEIERMLKANQGAIPELKEGIEEIIHKENVKAFRNIQSTLFDETGKIDAASRSAKMFIMIVLGLSGVNLLLGLIGLFL
ncbi:MAG: hypothetical protein LBI54_06420 [Lachnospiraceae bacterium]|jgi:DNA repair exonuclease SbcCD ATPase subunit|nr:hypothetical protein [Lachnospiraceae bacterium]